MKKFLVAWFAIWTVNGCTPADLTGVDPATTPASGTAATSQMGNETQQAATKPASTATEVHETVSAQGIWDGVYSVTQAQEGAQLYQRECALCHGADYGGTMGAPALKGPAFEFNWTGRTVEELYTFIHTRMPPTEPGKLTTEGNLAVVAAILQANAYPPAPSGAALTQPLPHLTIAPPEDR